MAATVNACIGSSSPPLGSRAPPLGAFIGLVVVQLMRLRRRVFLPGWPGFDIRNVVDPVGGAGAHPPIRLVVLGDSTTVGVGVDRAEESLPVRLAQRVADAEGRRVHVVSYGWAGARVADLVRDQITRSMTPRRASDHGPFLQDADIVAVVIGSNDATHNTPPARYRADLRATIDAIVRAAPEARIVLAGIPTFRGALSSLEPLIFLADQYARILRPISRAEADRAGILYADLRSGLPPLLAGQTGILAKDGFHPSAIGYDAWAEVIYLALEAPQRAREA